MSKGRVCVDDVAISVFERDAQLNVSKIADERINGPLDSTIGRAIYALSAEEKYDPIFDGQNAYGERKLTREEIIANLIDWVDPNQQGIKSGGSEDNLYTTYDDPYKAKNASFDSLSELNLVAGINDDWMQAFASRLSVSSSGKIDVNNCPQEMIASLLLAASDKALQPDAAMEMAKKVVEYRPLAPFAQPNDFVTFVKSTFNITLPPTFAANNVDISSKVFTLRSTGFAGAARVTITAVVDNTGTSLRWLYWRVN